MESHPNSPPHSNTTTSLTLLLRLRAKEGEAWDRFVESYGPMIFGWCRKSGLQPQDAADLVQSVFQRVLLNMDQFRRNREGDTFRGWLRQLTKNLIIDWHRRQQCRPQASGGTEASKRLHELPLEDEAELLHEFASTVQWGLDRVQLEFEQKSWQAFWLTVVEGKKATEVAQQLSLTVNAVYLAKSRILRRLREELGEVKDGDLQ